MQEILVETTQTYTVYIAAGILQEAGWIAARLQKPAMLALVTDANVNALYGDAAEQSFARAGFHVLRMVLAPGEERKNMDALAKLLEFFARENLSGADCVAALGGGVIGDLAGFAAAVYMRGIAFIQLPTTLLAAADASVGGKTAVNLQAGKNLAGVFRQPLAVLCDSVCLHSLPQRELASGAAECLKYALLAEENLLERLTRDGLNSDWEAVLPQCIRYKAKLVRQDEQDHSIRRLLNFGHTVGHAAEVLSGWQLRHGEGVALGMLLMSRAAERMGLCEQGLSQRIENALRALQLPACCPFSAEELANAALHDKKRKGESITLVLPEQAGKCFFYTIPTRELLPLLRLGLEERP